MPAVCLRTLIPSNAYRILASACNHLKREFAELQRLRAAVVAAEQTISVDISVRGGKPSP